MATLIRGFYNCLTLLRSRVYKQKGSESIRWRMLSFCLLVSFEFGRSPPPLCNHWIWRNQESFTALEENENCRLISLEDGSRFDLDQLESDQLLSDLKEWDYPIFDLLDRYTDTILSAVRPPLCLFINFCNCSDSSGYECLKLSHHLIANFTLGSLERSKW